MMEEMKRIIRHIRPVALLFIVFFIVCLSCQSQLSDGDLDIKECGIIDINESEYLINQVVPEKVSKNSTNKYIIENHTSYDMMWGVDYSLEYFEKNKWKMIPHNKSVPKVGFILHSGTIYSSEKVLNLGEKTLHDLVKDNKSKKGRYRIIRHVTLVPIGNYKICAEFEVI